jgi:hypothetical protein
MHLRDQGKAPLERILIEGDYRGHLRNFCGVKQSAIGKRDWVKE